MNRFLLIIVLLVNFAPVAPGQASAGGTHVKMTDDAVGIFLAADVKWKDGPGSLGKGAKFAVLEGDPTKEGPFTMRLLLPDGFSISPHFHSAVEHVTVLSGTFNLGMGESFNKSAARELPVGTFGFWPAGMKHFAWVKGDTVLQLNGMGPWTITYVNSADDPRNAAKKP